MRFDAAAVVFTANIDARAQLVGSDVELRRLGDLRQTVHEGPGVDVLRTGQPVIVADLHDCAVGWPVLANAGIDDLAVRSLALIRLNQLSTARFESPMTYALLTVARHHVEPFDDHELAVLEAASTVIGPSLVDQFGPVDEAGRLSSAVRKTDDVAVATGMTMSRLRVDSNNRSRHSPSSCLRDNTTVHDVASRIVAGEVDPLS